MTTAAPPGTGQVPLDEAALLMRRAAAHMRQHHGTADPFLAFYAELAHFLDLTASEGSLAGAAAWGTASRMARAYCRGALLPAD